MRIFAKRSSRWPAFIYFVLVALGVGCSSETHRSDSVGVSEVLANRPTVFIKPAPLLAFRGAGSLAPDKPGDTDCNSPGHWDLHTLYVFNSAGHPWRSAGPDLEHLDQEYVRCQYDNRANGGRWIESTWLAEDGVLYGWYHNEPVGVCPGTRLTAPRIGAVRSANNGSTWQDLGIILDAPPNSIQCHTSNAYFAGGNGDFSTMVDPAGAYIYFFLSTYTGALSEQGVSMARMRVADRDHPAGKVWKWHENNWNEPGLGGRVTAILPATIDWHQTNAAAFWGPSVHWNSYLKQYVMLLNRAQDSRWTQEGVYISFCPDLSRPDSWAEPVKILESQGDDIWYPQVFGTDLTRHETDKLAGRTARLFLRGQSRWQIQFLRPGERRH
jgi:hypothetical protein